MFPQTAPSQSRSGTRSRNRWPHRSTLSRRISHRCLDHARRIVAFGTALRAEAMQRRKRATWGHFEKRPRLIEPCRPRSRRRAPAPGRKASRTVPNRVLPSTAPTGALVIHYFLELSRGLRAFVQTQVSQARQVRRIGVSALVRRGGCQQLHRFGGLTALDLDCGANFR